MMSFENSIITNLRHFAKFPFRKLIGIEAIRKRIIFELRHEYHHEFNTNVSLGHGLTCPIYHWEEWASFTHIFFEEEYARAFHQMPLPTRWLDIGCYAGFFTLYTAWMRQKKGMGNDFECLLIDGDSRCEAAVGKLVQLNDLAAQVQFRHGVIGQDAAQQDFVEREFMTSSLSDGSDDGRLKRRVRQKNVAQRDLIEGGKEPLHRLSGDLGQAAGPRDRACRPGMDAFEHGEVGFSHP